MPALSRSAVGDRFELTAVRVLEEDPDGDLVVALCPLDIRLVEHALELGLLLG